MRRHGLQHYADLADAEAASQVYEARLEDFLPARLEGVRFTVDTHVRAFERHGEVSAVVVALVTFSEPNTAFRTLVSGVWQQDFAPLAVP